MTRHVTALLTRDAEGLFWMARYLERVENLARLIDVTQTFESPGREAEAWGALVAIMADQEGITERQLPFDAPSIKRFYLLDATNPNGIPGALEVARINARRLRPLISTEMWMQLNVFHRDVMSIDRSELEGDALSRLCRRIKEGVQAHTGITEGTFFRDQGWHFYEIGRLIERADQTTRLLDIKYHLLSPVMAEERRVVELTQWNALLRAAAGYHAFRRVSVAGFVPADVVAFLLLDTSFARSVALCIAQMEWHLHNLRSRYGLRDSAGVLERISEVRGGMNQDIPALLEHGLHGFLDGMQRDLQGLAELIGTAFFRDWRPLKATPGPTPTPAQSMGEGMTQTMGGMSQTLR